MRWDRLFDDLEAQAAQLELQERDALVGELSDGEWAETLWHELIGGHVVVDVLGVGRLEGVAGLVNQQIIQLSGGGVDRVIATSAVTVIRSAERRAAPPTVVAAALGWGHVLRRLRDAGEPIRLCLIDGTMHDGVIDVVGQDFVRVLVGHRRERVVTWRALAVISART